MRRKGLISLLLALLFPLAAYAQFYTSGSDPGSVRWSTLESPTYRLVYPRGLDSLARAYAVALERAVTPVGSSLGFTPNASYRGKMPVVLHPFSAHANGQVTWTPRRLELLTVPDAFSTDPTPWMTQLSVHESRHVAQMQPGAAKPFRWLGVLTGQIAAGAMVAVYGGPAFLEGDAVTAETALTAGGRGRTADFLEYYRVSFAAGDYRDYQRWRYGSLRWYTPDYYRAGYLAIGGIRAHFGVPDLTERFYRRIADKGGVAFLNWDKTVREATGLPFKAAFDEVCHSLQAQWAADEAARAPFMPSLPVSAVPRRFADYTELQAIGDDLYARRTGLTRSDALVRLSPDGKERPVTLTGSGFSGLQYSEPAGRLYWSEYVPDVRWPLRSWSVIRTFDGKTARSLTRRTRYYNPVASPEEAVLAVTEYALDGSSSVVLLDAENGKELKRWSAPAGVQVQESVWVDGALYASAITEEGMGLYRVEDFSSVLAARRLSISQLWTWDESLLFTCNLTGVNELYRLDPENGSVERLSSTRFGASDFEILRDTLFYSVLQPEGRLVRKTALSDLQPQAADFSVMPEYPFAEALSAGEKPVSDEDDPVELSEPQPYGKLAHLFRFHSWLPVYVKYDSVESLSFDTILQNAGLGATAFWQNDLGSGYGFAGYHAAWSDGRWRHSLHADFNYSGLYPVLEASVDLGDRDALLYRVEQQEENGKVSLKTDPRGVPSVSARLSAYIPWNFSSGGWLRGLVPRATLSLTNDRYETGSAMHRASVSLRGYAVQRTPASRLYPRFGLGAEAGYSFRWTPALIAPAGYAYLYGYLPGLHETHGLRWSLLGAKHFGGQFTEVYANTAPRGFEAAVGRRIAAYPTQFKGSVDYKMPLIPVDRALLGPVAYLRNFELTLHADYTAFSVQSSSGALYSAGADLAAVLGNLLWIPYRTRIGVGWNYNGGPSYASFEEQGVPVKRHKFSLIFSVEM